MEPNYIEGYMKALERVLSLLENQGKFGLDKIVHQLKEEINNVKAK